MLSALNLVFSTASIGQEDHYMKSIFIFLVSLFAATSTFANRGEGLLSFTVAGNSQIRIIVDNRQYDDNQKSIAVAAGNHTIKVYRVRGNMGRGRKGLGSHDLLYSATLYIKPRYHVDVMVNRFGRALVDESPINGRGYVDYDDDRDYNWNDRYDDDDIRRPMSNSDFGTFRETLRRQPFETTRLAMAKQTIERNGVTTGMVGQLLELFSFDNNKLELAKFAYRYTTDKRNYYQLYDSFAYSRSREDLDEYIRNYRD
jgi:hypothetical protein